MLKRALIVWVVMLLVASVNGAAREAVLIPAMGEVAGRAVSTVTLSILIAVLTCLAIRWIHPTSKRDAWLAGALWVALTLAFEFLAGHFLFGNAWPDLMEDYDVLHGRIWPLALVTTAVAPRVCAGVRRLLADS